MKIEEAIEIIRPKVEKFFEGDSSGHDITHLERTKNAAIHIAEKEGANVLVCGIAGFLHDIHRIWQTQQNRFVDPKETLSAVRELICDLALDEKTIAAICDAVEFHEVYNWHDSENKNRAIETLVVQDADNLDAIGAVAIGRCFTYGGSHNIPMHTEDADLDEDFHFVETKNDESSLQHFYHKLFKLEGNMNTQTAKELAKERTLFMREYTKQFLKEWNCEY